MSQPEILKLTIACLWFRFVRRPIIHNKSELGFCWCRFHSSSSLLFYFFSPISETLISCSFVLSGRGRSLAVSSRRTRRRANKRREKPPKVGGRCICSSLKFVCFIVFSPDWLLVWSQLLEASHNYGALRVPVVIIQELTITNTSGKLGPNNFRRIQSIN